ncbi:hypothetical protein ANN_05871 [Periplaneta americana]|uniref:Uncharacterized protein n=1 Tax=Periplaneta americana TaxID=6978 RepID=A0ABQ8TDU2_PERAM|nr:hypothetical protein ANN_05871 [Periplaneta americana]
MDAGNTATSKCNEGDNASEMSPGSSAEPQPGNLSQQDLNPGPLISRLAMLTITPHGWTSSIIPVNQLRHGPIRFAAPRAHDLPLERSELVFLSLRRAVDRDFVSSKMHMGSLFFKIFFLHKSCVGVIGLHLMPRYDFNFISTIDLAIVFLEARTHDDRVQQRSASDVFARAPRHVARMGESRNAYRVLVGRSEGKGSLGRQRRRWEYNIKMDLREVGYDDRDWINLVQDRDRWWAYSGIAPEILSSSSNQILCNSANTRYNSNQGAVVTSCANSSVTCGTQLNLRPDLNPGAEIRASLFSKNPRAAFISFPRSEIIECSIFEVNKNKERRANVSTSIFHTRVTRNKRFSPFH